MTKLEKFKRFLSNDRKITIDSSFVFWEIQSFKDYEKVVYKDSEGNELEFAFLHKDIKKATIERGAWVIKEEMGDLHCFEVSTDKLFVCDLQPNLNDL